MRGVPRRREVVDILMCIEYCVKLGQIGIASDYIKTFPQRKRPESSVHFLKGCTRRVELIFIIARCFVFHHLYRVIIDSQVLLHHLC